MEARNEIGECGMETAVGLDVETEFLLSKRQTGNEWELFKENVRPLKRGRNIIALNNALKSHSDNRLRKSLVDTRRRMVEAIEEYKGDDPLQPWIECIKWVQEAFPPGGDCSGLVVIYEQCVRTFWHSDCYKDDLRYLKVWLEYADNCADAEVIYSFLSANEIGKTHSLYYISYGLQLESKCKMKAANDVYNLGISRNAQPIDKLKDAYRKFLARSMRAPKAIDEDSMEKCLPPRSFGMVLSKGENRMQSDTAGKNLKRDNSRAPLAKLNIYKDSNAFDPHGHDQPDMTSKTELNCWHTLGSRTERNKENNSIPSKWTSYKIQQRPGSRIGGVASASARIEVFVDEECQEGHKAKKNKDGKSSTLLLGQVDGRNLKRDTKLLRENPLCNFPPSSLPR